MERYHDCLITAKLRRSFCDAHLRIRLWSGNDDSFPVWQIDWNQSAQALHNWIRGNDKVPGAWAEVDGQVKEQLFCWLPEFTTAMLSVSAVSRCAKRFLLQKLTFYGSTLVENSAATAGEPLEIPGASQPGIVTKAGLVLFGNDGKAVSQLMNWNPSPFQNKSFIIY